MTTMPTFRIPTRQGGASLIFALVTLVAMSLAAVALLRSVDTTSLVVGNLGFRQDAVADAAQGSEEAIDWLDSNKIGTALDGANTAQGYYAIAYENLDATNSRPSTATRVVVDWGDDNCSSIYNSGSFATCLDSKAVSAVNNKNGNVSRYVITRLCAAEKPSSDPTNACARAINSVLSEGGEKGEINYNRTRGSSLAEAGPYFRIIVRTVGARNTVSYVETLVHF